MHYVVNEIVPRAVFTQNVVGRHITLANVLAKASQCKNQANPIVDTQRSAICLHKGPDRSLFNDRLREFRSSPDIILITRYK